MVLVYPAYREEMILETTEDFQGSLVSCSGCLWLHPEVRALYGRIKEGTGPIVNRPFLLKVWFPLRGLSC